MSVDDGGREKRKDKEGVNRKLPAVIKWYRGMTTMTQTACEEGEAWATDHREALDSLLQITERHWMIYYRSQRGTG